MSERFTFEEFPEGVSRINPDEEDEDGSIEIRAEVVPDDVEIRLSEVRELLNNARDLVGKSGLRFGGKLAGYRKSFNAALQQVEAIIHTPDVLLSDVVSGLNSLAREVTVFAAESDNNRDLNGLSARITEMSKKLIS
jgi:hypothetical protein